MTRQSALAAPRLNSATGVLDGKLKAMNSDENPRPPIASTMNC